MMEIWQQFHFMRPWWLAILVLLPPAAWLATRAGMAQRQLARLVDVELLPQVLSGGEHRHRLAGWLFVLAWALCALALAGPTWSRVSEPLYANRAAQVVAISLAQDMLSRDMPPSRLDRARQKAHALLDGNRDGLNALIGYAGAAFVVAPLTADAHSLSDLLDAMAPDTMPVPGNDAADAIARGVQLIKEAKLGGGVLVLITDQADAAADAAARAALAAGVQVSVLGVGSAQGGPVPLGGGDFLRDGDGRVVLAPRDDAALSRLAAAGGGRYEVMTANQDDVQALHAGLRAVRAKAMTDEAGDAWQDQGPWLLLPLLLLVALGFRRGWLLLVVLATLPMVPGPAMAAGWADWWQRPDQQAAQALRNGHPKLAQELARDPALRGTAAYRAGGYAAAAQAFREAPGSNGAYNLGNALAQQHQYGQAIAAYDHALKLDPDNADARANRQALEEWQRKQRQQSEQGKQQQAGKQGEQKTAKGGEQTQDGKDQQGQQAPQNQPSGQDQSGRQQDDGQSTRDGRPPPPETAEQRAARQSQTAEAQRGLKEQMDQALADQSKPTQPPGHQLGALAADDPQARLPAALRQALQRVPDDPGALLRRKFALEYQQRMAGDGGGTQP
ncbi:MAG: tetratricopeptide repeat protein [Xanthomonadales bacterium]|nr:tetratricopeptide repeat protein [Xanthomonadales bacterium]